MRNLVAFALLAAVAVVSSKPAFDQQPDYLKEKDDRWNTAMETGDLDSFARWMATALPFEIKDVEAFASDLLPTLAAQKDLLERYPALQREPRPEDKLDCNYTSSPFGMAACILEQYPKVNKTYKMIDEFAKVIRDTDVILHAHVKQGLRFKRDAATIDALLQFKRAFKNFLSSAARAILKKDQEFGFGDSAAVYQK